MVRTSLSPVACDSTIVRLLLRLYDVDRGTVFVNGRDVRTVTQRSLRGQIGVVTQDTVRLHFLTSSCSMISPNELTHAQCC